jgi:hypothetical protein
LGSATVASGRGETLDAIADIADVPAEKRPQLYTALQVNFDNIYPDEGVMSADVSLKISDIISGSATPDQYHPSGSWRIRPCGKGSLGNL